MIQKPSPEPQHRARKEGIALLVVMVVFVVLYLVVHQLHFSTKMEEHIAQIRYGEGESTVAILSAGLFVITHLIEDLKNDSMDGGTGTAGEAGGTALRGLDGGKAGGPSPPGGDPGGAGGSFAKIAPSPAGTGKARDSLYENLFQDNRQQVGDITVKITIVDGERSFDLNHLFDYVRLEGEDPEGGALDLSEGELVDSVAGGGGGKDAERRLGDLVRERNAERRAARRGTGGGKTGAATGAGDKNGAGSTAAAADPDAAGGEEDPAVQAMNDYEQPEFEPPEPERIEATKAMVERAIVMMFSINENEYGYRYSRKYDARGMAERIVEYVLARREATFQNRIYIVTELLNVSSDAAGPTDVTPEVFYGPIPQLTGDDEVMVGDGFILRRDEFGDVVPEYQYGDFDEAAVEDEKRQLAELEEQFGKFADFGGLGLGRLSGNALTRGMQELPMAVDENGEDYVVEVPRPIGLKDLFTTFSTGMININTASVPVLFALLQSATEEEANLVALNIRDWRKRFQEETDEAGITTVGTEKDSSGRRGSRSGRNGKSNPGAPVTAGAAGIAGVDPNLADPSMESSYQDLELNTFTDLQQLELIDGTDEGRDDLLRKDEGIAKASTEENDTLYRRVLKDLQKVAVFSSMYFNAELKAKPKEGRSVKTGCLTVRRDTKKKMVDVVLWKNLQK